jgi:putative FmdB family regulatory protein
MPLYDYTCKKCNASTEYLILSEEDEPTKCEKCGSKRIERNYNTVGWADILGPSDFLPGAKKNWRSNLSIEQRADMAQGRRKYPY